MIHTKVAKVLNPTSVILAAGSADGVKEGMEFVIFSLSETIFDPETGADLGQLELVKGRVYAVHVQDRMTWAQTKSRVVEREVDPLAGITTAMGVFGKRTIRETVYDKLRVDAATPVETDTVVRVGDKARSVYQPDFALTNAAT